MLKQHYFRDIFVSEYGADYALAARDAGVSEQQIKNWRSQNRALYRLANGQYLIHTERVTVVKPKPGLSPEINDVELTIYDLVQKVFRGSRAAAAIAAGISEAQLNNMLTIKKRDRPAVKAETGEFFLLNTKTIILPLKHKLNKQQD